MHTSTRITTFDHKFKVGDVITSHNSHEVYFRVASVDCRTVDGRVEYMLDRVDAYGDTHSGWSNRGPYGNIDHYKLYTPKVKPRWAVGDVLINPNSEVIVRIADVTHSSKGQVMYATERIDEYGAKIDGYEGPWYGFTFDSYVPYVPTTLKPKPRTYSYRYKFDLPFDVDDFNGRLNAMHAVERTLFDHLGERVPVTYRGA